MLDILFFFHILSYYIEIPVQNSNTFQNGTDGVTGLSADIYEGQHEKIYSLSVLGTCRIETRDEYGLGQLKMRVVVKIDGYGLMHVTAEQKGHPENKGTFTCTINIDDDSAYQRGDEYKEQKNDEEDIEMAKKVEAEFMHFMNQLYVYKGQNDIVDTNWRIWEEVLRTPNRKIEHVKKLTLTLEEILAGIKDNEEKKKKQLMQLILIVLMTIMIMIILVFQIMRRQLILPMM